jgi:tRNA pseudouridine38-40 synthase
MRYFLTLAYLGTDFCGWQRQPNAQSVQAVLESALSVVTRQNIEITGCGRTDTGVHARYYVAHFDLENALPERFLIALNSLLPYSIAIYSVHLMHDAAHARYDAFERSYTYHLGLRKDPFSKETAWFYPQHQKLDLQKMQAVADLLPTFTAFFPFCKTNSGVDSYDCQLSKAYWDIDENPHQLTFHITANRFLRGMVRLIVGACIQAGMDQISVESVRKALEQQTPLEKSLSVPPEGLFLSDIRYPYPF